MINNLINYEMRSQFRRKIAQGLSKNNCRFNEYPMIIIFVYITVSLSQQVSSEIL